MFDISWSELLILAVVTLIFVGPKDLPRFLAFVGKWAGIAKRHASDFRQVFDQAMREAELDQMRREVEEMQANIERSVREADKKTAEAAAAAETTPSIKPEVSPSKPEAIDAPKGEAAPVPEPQEPIPTPDDHRPGPEVVTLEAPEAQPAAHPVAERQGGA